jgi:Glycosyltransferases involved in cell wall biogenesis
MFFSIIIATYNAGSVLPRLLESIAQQKCRDFNLIIQDGASSDNTISIAESYRERLPNLIIKTASDSGIYDAWNKAVMQNEELGQWVLFLGADDQLADQYVLEKVRVNISKKTGITYACGSLQFTDENGEKLNWMFEPEIDNFWDVARYRMPIPHPALFHKADHLKEFLFDAKFRISGDYEQLLRAWKTSSQCLALNMLVSYMARGGVSANPSSVQLAEKEFFYIRKKYFFSQRFLIIPLIFLDRRLFGIKIKIKGWIKGSPLLVSAWQKLSLLKKKFLKD